MPEESAGAPPSVLTDRLPSRRCPKALEGEVCGRDDPNSSDLDMLRQDGKPLRSFGEPALATTGCPMGHFRLMMTPISCHRWRRQHLMKHPWHRPQCSSVAITQAESPKSRKCLSQKRERLCPQLLQFLTHPGIVDLTFKNGGRGLRVILRHQPVEQVDILKY